MHEPPKPRADKTRCDPQRTPGLQNAVNLLKSGFDLGMVSVRHRQGWPQNVWTVDADGIAYEAQLGNAGQGAYHGYPMKLDDPFTEVVRQEWSQRKQ